MISDRLKERFIEIEKLAKGAGLDPYDVHFFQVPASIIYEVASYGLPTRYSHWSFGRVYQHQKTQGEMGMSKIYELILNNDPSYAFLDKNNTDTINLLVAAHCYAHSDFFKNNVMFRECGETQMVDRARMHADFVDGCRRDFGDEEVDKWLDIALSLERHIDVHKGLNRKPYPKRHVEYKKRPTTEWEDVVHIAEDIPPLMEKTIKGLHIPPAPERDLLWFLSEYSSMESWQKRIFEIVRRESYYFYPQFRTKVMNEGWASYWHAELMRQYAYGSSNDYGVKDIKYPLTSEEHMEFASHHEKVVQPGPKIPLKVKAPDPSGKMIKQWNPHVIANPHLFRAATRLNPYYVGFRIFRDIKERWDEYYKEGVMLDEWDNEIPVTIDGNQKIRQVMMEEDDVSFFRNYLTDELCDDLHLFGYGNTEDFDDNYGIQEEQKKSQEMTEQIVNNKTVVVRSKKVKQVINALARSRNNYGVPEINIRRVDEAGLLRLEHSVDDGTNIDIDYAKNVLQYVWRVWNRPVELIRKDEDRTWIMYYDGTQVSVDHETPDYPDVIEDDTPSSW